MLAQSFLILIGIALMADGLGFHIPTGDVYFAMFISFSPDKDIAPEPARAGHGS